ncbi:MAG: endonuclease/exonuclease/phosphatase family protein [Planctomycetaceae bacterium]|jgi:endonuclease/exonuclease/phosphatase family metal-dependent hydrolase|nr:endonuclease/exonuclease/phosphatase family protein [Planctomycetaceae bacterium]
MKTICLTIFSLLISFHLFAEEPIRVLTINVRLSTARDGENAWEYRKEFLTDILATSSDANKPYDFIGSQETVVDPRPEFNQVDYIISKMPKYDALWLSREKTPEQGEAMLILWRRERWRIDETDQGTFWLSETPDIPGSKTDPKAGCPRCVTFGLFRELKDNKTTGRKLYICNTHYDHLSEESRQRAAKQVMTWISTRKDKNAPLVIMGDLNCGEKSPAIRYMQGEPMTIDNTELQPPLALTDTFRAANPDAVDVGTFHGFKEEVGQEKIDYIFSTKELKTISSKIIRTKRDHRWPTDHCPVEAILNWRL